MNLYRRLVLGSGIAIALAGAMAVAAFAAAGPGGGGGLPPGSYTFTGTNAAAFFGTFGLPGPPTSGASVSVFRGMTSFQPEESQNGSGTVSNMTTIFLQVFSGGSAFGCFVLSPTHAGDFVVASDMTSATLQTTLTAGDQCPGPPRVLTSSGPMAAAGGGGGFGLQFPIVLNVTWTWKGVAGAGESQNQFQCGDYETQSQTVSLSAGQNAKGTIKMGQLTVLSGASASSAGLRTDTTNLEVSGAPLAACFGF